MGPRPHTRPTTAHTSFLVMVRSVRPARLIHSSTTANGCRITETSTSKSSFMSASYPPYDRLHYGAPRVRRTAPAALIQTLSNSSLRDHSSPSAGALTRGVY